MSEGRLRVSTEGAENWWRLLEKVAIVGIVKRPLGHHNGTDNVKRAVAGVKGAWSIASQMLFMNQYTETVLI